MAMRLDFGGATACESRTNDGTFINNISCSALLRKTVKILFFQWDILRQCLKTD